MARILDDEPNADDEATVTVPDTPLETPRASPPASPSRAPVTPSLSRSASPVEAPEPHLKSASVQCDDLASARNRSPRRAAAATTLLVKSRQQQQQQNATGVDEPSELSQSTHFASTLASSTALSSSSLSSTLSSSSSSDDNLDDTTTASSVSSRRHQEAAASDSSYFSEGAWILSKSEGQIFLDGDEQQATSPLHKDKAKKSKHESKTKTTRRNNEQQSDGEIRLGDVIRAAAVTAVTRQQHFGLSEVQHQPQAVPVQATHHKRSDGEIEPLPSLTSLNHLQQQQQQQQKVLAGAKRTDKSHNKATTSKEKATIVEVQVSPRKSALKNKIRIEPMRT